MDFLTQEATVPNIFFKNGYGFINGISGKKSSAPTALINSLLDLCRQIV
jgi:hypothetical protein